MRRTAALPALLVVFASLTGCTTPTETRVPIAPGSYAEHFDATREVLREAGFPIERVDAGAGVIATGPKPTAGLATPWDGEQRTLGQEWQDLINHHARAARVTFEPAGNPTEALVEVTIYRASRPGWRPETESVRTSSRWRDPGLARRGLAPNTLIPLRADRDLAAVLARRIAERGAAQESTGLSAGADVQR